MAEGPCVLSMRSPLGETRFGMYEPHYVGMEPNSCDSTQGPYKARLTNCHKGPFWTCQLVVIAMSLLGPNSCNQCLPTSLLGVHFESLPKIPFFNTIMGTNWHIQHEDLHVFFVYLRILNMPIGSSWHFQTAAFWHRVVVYSWGVFWMLLWAEMFINSFIQFIRVVIWCVYSPKVTATFLQPLHGCNRW